MGRPVYVQPIPKTYLDTDASMTADSDVKVPSQKAVKAYVASSAPAPTVATGAEVNTGTDNTKMVTPKAVKDSDVAYLSDIPTVPVKATGAEIIDGADDAKFATPKALADAGINGKFWQAMKGTPALAVSTFATGDVNTGTEVITVGINIPTGTPIEFTSTTTVPAGLTAGTLYYAINASATTIKVASTLALAFAGTAIDLTSQGTGTHSIYRLNTLTLTDASNANKYDLLYAKGYIVSFVVSATTYYAMVFSSAYASNVVTLVLVGDSVRVGFTVPKISIVKADTFEFLSAGNQSTGTDIARIHRHKVTETMKPLHADASVKTAGTTGTGTYDINDDGTTIFTEQNNRPQIATTATIDASPRFPTTSTMIAKESILSLDVDVAQTTQAIEGYVILWCMPESWKYKN